MNHGSDIRFKGTAVRDAEMQTTPRGEPVTTIDLAMDEGGRTVYVPVRLENELAREICRTRTRGELFLVSGHLWRPEKTPRDPYPQLTVVAHLFRRLAKVETPSLFEEVGV